MSEFKHQTHEYTIKTDPYNWILIYHPEGPSYRKDGSLIGRRSFYGGLHHLTARLLDMKVKDCRDFEDINNNLPKFVKEMRAINKLEIAKEEL